MQRIGHISSSDPGPVSAFDMELTLHCFDDDEIHHIIEQINQLLESLEHDYFIIRSRKFQDGLEVENFRVFTCIKFRSGRPIAVDAMRKRFRRLAALKQSRSTSKFSAHIKRHRLEVSLLKAQVFDQCLNQMLKPSWIGTILPGTSESALSIWLTWVLLESNYYPGLH